MIVALDLSLTATGFATDTESGVLVPPKNADRGTARLRWLRNEIERLIEVVPPGTMPRLERDTLYRHADLVVIEGYAFGRPNQAHQLGELGGVIRVSLVDHGVPFVEVPPSSLKLFATGKGNAPKDEVLAAAIRKLEYAHHDHNEADALWLHRMAETHYSRLGIRPPPIEVTDYQRRTLEKVKFPHVRALVPGAVIPQSQSTNT